MSGGDFDQAVRLRAFDFLAEKTSQLGEVLPCAVLSTEFVFEGKRVPLIGPQGIFKPAVLPEMPLSIATAPVTEGTPRPYNDGFDEHGLLNYRYRGTNPLHHENVGLRLAMQRRVPLIYLFGVVKREYMPVWPVRVVGDDPADLCFKVAVDEQRLGEPKAPAQLIDEITRSYVTVLTAKRMHQAAFRERVLHAYRLSCSICRLRHRELLEAAHILPDGHPRGEPIVPNGLALCKLHHAAFDAHILGVRPDYVIEVRRDVLQETDGPMLLHGLQEIAGRSLIPPADRRLHPRQDFLEERRAFPKSELNRSILCEKENHDRALAKRRNKLRKSPGFPTCANSDNSDQRPGGRADTKKRSELLGSALLLAAGIGAKLPNVGALRQIGVTEAERVRAESRAPAA